MINFLVWVNLCYLYSLPLSINLLDSPDLLETTIDDVTGPQETVETSQAPDDINSATKETGLEGPEIECGSK